LVLGNTTEKHSHVVTSFTRVKLFVEGFDTSDGGGGVLSFDANHVNVIIDFATALFDGASDDASSAWNVQT
jgi:hypothetical protein